MRSGNVGRYYSKAIFIALITFLTYLPSLQNGFVNLDDEAYIYENPHLMPLNLNLVKWSFSSFSGGLWHPLSGISHALDYAVWGLDPFGYHLTNIILHSINTFLVFILATILVHFNASDKDKARNITLVTASVTALLFGIHPLHVESVAWISERKDVLCALFFLISIIFYIKYCFVKSSNKALYYSACLLFFTMALLSKPMAISLPIVFLILDFYPFNRLKTGKDLKLSIIEKLPFFILSTLTALITMQAAQSAGSLMSSKTLGNFPFSVRLFIACRSYIIYLTKIIMPDNLAPLYPYPAEVNLFSLEYAGTAVLFLLISFICFNLLERNKYLLAAWLYYILTLIPVIGLIQTGSQSAADRYMYLPSLGPLLLTGLAISDLYEKTLKRYRFILVAALFICSGMLIAKSVNQIQYWHDSITLWSLEINRYPKSIYKAYNYRGTAHISSGNYQAAINDFNKAIELNRFYADAYINRGLSNNYLGKYYMGISDLDKAIKLQPQNATAFLNRGNAYLNTGNYSKAMTDFDKSIELDPFEPIAYYNRGIIYIKSGNYSQALLNFNKAIELNPRGADIYCNRGTAYMNSGDYASAISDYNKTIEINPVHFMAYLNLGIAHSKSGDYFKTLIYLNKAVELNPSYSIAYKHRGAIYMRLKRYEQAITDFHKVIGLEPDTADAYSNLGVAYKASGDLKKAIIYEKRAAELK